MKANLGTLFDHTRINIVPLVSRVEDVDLSSADLIIMAPDNMPCRIHVYTHAPCPVVDCRVHPETGSVKITASLPPHHEERTYAEEINRMLGEHPCTTSVTVSIGLIAAGLMLETIKSLFSGRLVSSDVIVGPPTLVARQNIKEVGRFAFGNLPSVCSSNVLGDHSLPRPIMGQDRRE